MLSLILLRKEYLQPVSVMIMSLLCKRSPVKKRKVCCFSFLLFVIMHLYSGKPPKITVLFRNASVEGLFNVDVPSKFGIVAILFVLMDFVDLDFA
jgi:hypothetical protein